MLLSPFHFFHVSEFFFELDRSLSGGKVNLINHLS